MPFADPGAGRVVRSNTAGSLHTRITLAGTVKMGDLIGYSTGYKRADADTGPIEAKFIAMNDGVSGDVISVCTEGVVEGFTGATPGDPVYPSGTAGQYSASQVNGRASVGHFLSATAAYVRTNPTA